MPRKAAEFTVSREAIMQAAAEVFQERGYQGATMADIAKRVRLTAGSLYHHFPAGKRDLLLAVLSSGLETVLDQIRVVLMSTNSATKRLEHMITIHVINATQNVSVGAAMVFEIRALLEMSDAQAERQAFLKDRDEFERSFRQVIEEGIVAGEFRAVDVPVFVKGLLGAHNWINVWYRPGGRLNGEMLAVQMVDMFLHALRVTA